MDSFDIGIIGAGPGGYVAAIRAAQLGASVALIEKDKLGGTCLNRGCIPTKAILASVHCLNKILDAKSFGIQVDKPVVSLPEVNARQQKIVAKMGKGLSQLLATYKNITIYSGDASISSQNLINIAGKEDKQIEVKNIIIATGSESASLGKIVPDHDLIIDSNDALVLEELPKDMLIIGGGAIGVEWARIFSAFGVDVTIVEMFNRIVPACDSDLSNQALKLFNRSKVKTKLSLRVESIETNSNKVSVTLSDGEVISVEKVLLAVGRKPNSDLKGLKELAIEFNGKFIRTNEFMQTNIPNIYAIGDVVGKLMLAHSASHEGIVAVESILGRNPKPVDYTCVPFCIYGEPEMASVGLTEEQANTLNLEYETSKFYYAANGKAVAESESIGFVKAIIDKNTEKVLGVHIIGAGASDIIHQAVIVIKTGLTKTAFKDIVFAHPTLSESFYETLARVHIPNI